MKQFGYLRGLYMSFYSRAFYRDVAQNWDAGVLLYLLTVLAICWAFLMFQIQPMFNKGVSRFATEAAAQTPAFKIKDGEVVTPENRPYLIKDPDSNEVLAIIDTSGKYTLLAQNARYLLLTKHELAWTNRAGVIKTYALPKDLTISFDPVILKEKVIGWTQWAWMVIFPILLMGSFCYRIIQSMLYAVLGKILGLFCGIRLGYITILKLTMVALTPAIVISTLMQWFYIAFPRQWLFYFALTLCYILFSIWANRDTPLNGGSQQNAT